MVRVIAIGAVVDGLLGVFKIMTGAISQSHALVADGVHSPLELGADLLVTLAAKWGHEQPYVDHTHGHDQIESLATLILGSILLSSWRDPKRQHPMIPRSLSIWINQSSSGQSPRSSKRK
tara:strand:+ start:24 stop:383 length:360 start_codon:yes stop_codon:yes gene_type:complete